LGFAEDSATVCKAYLDVLGFAEDSATVCKAYLDVLGFAEDSAPYGLMVHPIRPLFCAKCKKIRNIFRTLLTNP
ncbi:MAG: hypothetical protein IKC75_05300, partial [Clostridia bacterium]|nr:hypothetical protein [Clostridia bacterium]